MHIAVLMGGLSSEREISKISGNAVCTALKELGYEHTIIDPDQNLSENIKKIQPDIIFNALHGTYGEDGSIPGLLNLLNIPYTHSGVFASSLAFDKQRTKIFLEGLNILSPPGHIIKKEDILNNNFPVQKPFVIKPIADGSSVETYIISGDSDLNFKDTDFRYSSYLIEKYIPGKELSVAVIDEKPLGVIELEPSEGFYDYTNKYTDGKTKHIMPANIDKEIYDLALDIAFNIHKNIGCSGLSRSDFRFDYEGDKKLYFLEVNTHPGLTPLSTAPEMALHAGINFNQLIKYLIENATCGK